MITIIIAGFGLGLGLVNFYWIFLRNKKSLFLARIDNSPRLDDIAFALMNNSRKDILLSEIACCFGSLSLEGHSFSPAQKVQYKESDSLLLPAGKGILCHVAFTEKFTSTFIMEGKIYKDDIRTHNLYVKISWIETNGTSNHREVLLYELGFRLDGQVAHRKPLLSATDLYPKFRIYLYYVNQYVGKSLLSKE